MDRTACVNLPVFPVQLLLRRHPDWEDQPVAVVDSDRPQGTILWVNDRALFLRILPGMRYAAGLSLAGSLRAAVVPKQEIEGAVASLGKGLRSFSPRVEPAGDEPGVFWIDASGLERLYGSLGRWAACLQADMSRAGFRATVVVGFNRFGTYALARAKQGIIVLKEPGEERLAAQEVPLHRLALEPKTRELLERLGIRTIGQFMGLPPEGVAKRFGPEAYRLHRLASGELRPPLQPERPEPPAKQSWAFDHPEIHTGRLVGVMEQLLRPVLDMLASRGQALREVQIRFCFERLAEHTESIRPAAPTLDAKQVMELIRLRLEAFRLPEGVVEIELQGRSVAAVPGQYQLFGPRRQRELAAANRALARVRVELGDKAVVRARLREGHLPQGRFVWEPFDTLPAPRPGPAGACRLIRRTYGRSLPLEPRTRQEPDGWLPVGLEQGPVIRLLGPYIVSGGWWLRPVHREYYFAETRKGGLFWVYYDRHRRRWFLQGRVE